MISFPYTAEVSFDANGHPHYDRATNSEVQRAFNNLMYEDGVDIRTGDAYRVTTGTGMSVTVLCNGAWCKIAGAFGFETAATRTLAVQASETLDRIDRVILRNNLATSGRNIDLYVLKGVAANSPVAPNLTKSSERQEIAIADIFISKNSSAITQQRITDLRLNTTLCGTLANAFGNVDFTPYYTQIKALTKDLETAIKNIEQGSETMLKSAWTKNGIVNGAISDYTHSKSGTTHYLYGDGTNIKFKATADFASGDTFAVNGTSRVAKLQNGEPIDGDFFKSGNWVSGTFDGVQLNFKGGGGGANLKVLAFATENSLPTRATENTIAVITNTPINGYIVAKDEPTSGLKNGLVWVLIGGASQTPIVLDKKTGISIYPQGTQQYINGAWADKTIKVYQNASWRDVGIFLVNYGKDCTAASGGWTCLERTAPTATYKFTANGINIIQTTSDNGLVLISKKNYPMSDFGEIKFIYNINSALPPTSFGYALKITPDNTVPDTPTSGGSSMGLGKHEGLLTTKDRKGNLYVMFSPYYQINIDINQIILF